MTLAIRLTRMREIRRYALAVVAPSLVSVAHLAVQLMMLSHLDATAFGTFAFMMVLLQFGYGLSNALISTPYDVGSSQGTADDGMKRTLYAANAVFAVAFGLVCGLVGLLLDGGRWIAVFALFGTLAMLRWFGRVFNYVRLRPTAAALSDLVYSLTLLGLAALLSWAGRFDVLTVSLAFLAATALSSVCLGSDFLVAQFGGLRGARLRPYADVWRHQSRWTLVGVTTTEFTSNVHSYLVTFLAGPASFAPISAAGLFMRPVLLTMTALTQLERPAIGRALARGDTPAALTIKRRFFAVLLVGWVGTIALAVLVIHLWPGLVIKPEFDPRTVETAVALLSAISLLQIWQAPNNVLLQALARFRPLSHASILSCAVSVAGVLAMLLTLPPVFSLIGIAFGQFVMALYLTRAVSQWRDEEASPSSLPSPLAGDPR